MLLKLSETAGNRKCGKILDTTMPEFADRGLVRYRLGAKVDADEPAHRSRVSYGQIWCMPMKSSGDLVGLLDIFSVNKCHAFNDLGEVFEAA